MTDWIEHTTDTCPVDPETVVEVRIKHGASIIDWSPPRPARRFRWSDPCITHYRIITPAKPPEPEEPFAPWDSWPKRSSEALPSEPDLINLRLECLKLAVAADPQGLWDDGVVGLADYLLHYVLNGSEAARD